MFPSPAWSRSNRPNRTMEVKCGTRLVWHTLEMRDERTSFETHSVPLFIIVEDFHDREFSSEIHSRIVSFPALAHSFPSPPPPIPFIRTRPLPHRKRFLLGWLPSAYSRHLRLGSPPRVSKARLLDEKRPGNESALTQKGTDGGIVHEMNLAVAIASQSSSSS